MTAWTIGKEFTFDAAHSLPHLPDTHKCSRVHGHTYTVIVAVEAYGLRDGMVFDYALLDPVKAWIDTMLDHRNLNEVVPYDAGPTTAENLATWMWGVIHEIIRGALTAEWGDTTPDEPSVGRVPADGGDTDPRVALAQMHLTVTVKETPRTFASYRGGTLA